MSKQVRVILPEEVHAQVKSQAAFQGVTLAKWIEAAIMEKLGKPTKKGKAKACSTSKRSNT